MYTINENYKYDKIIKKSKFITLLIKVENIDKVKDILNELKITYPDATHYCYAYIINNISKSSDDGEPSKTAGLPILKCLENNKLTNVLAVVIRYFGGIKLGANGLIRAYNNCVKEAINNVKLVELIDGINLDITFEYNKVKDIDYLLKDIKINSKSFDDLITYNIDIELPFLETIKNNNLKYEILEYKKIDKEI